MSQTDLLLKKLAAADAFSGAVLIAKDGKLIFRTFYGMASKAYNAPNRLDTKFNLASVNKIFTAVAIAQLAEQGKLSFSDPVGKFLPDYPNKQVAEKVTIHHLLTHTSGKGDFYGAKYIGRKGVLREVKDYFPLFADAPLSFEPGERWQHANAGFVLLGAIIEKISGENYFDYVRRHIFKPSGMTQTDFYKLITTRPILLSGTLISLTKATIILNFILECTETLPFITAQKAARRAGRFRRLTKCGALLPHYALATSSARRGLGFELEKSVVR